MAGASRSKSGCGRLGSVRVGEAKKEDREESKEREWALVRTRESIHDLLDVCEVGVHACDDVVVSLGCIAVAVEGVGLA